MDRPEIRPLDAADVDSAERVMRRAFGSFIGLPEPESFGGDSSFVRSRWQSDPQRAFGAFLGDELVGSNLATRWGSFGFFGPLSVDPRYWDRGFATPLMEPIVALLDSWDLAGSGLFTFPQSLKHIALYQKFGFRPATLNVVLQKALESSSDPGMTVDASQDPRDREGELGICREIAESVLEGLDLSAEIEGAVDHGFGDVVVSASGNGFALCHLGAGSEAGTDTCYVKFAAARSGPGAEKHFNELLDVSESFAAGQGAKQLVAGVNVGRRKAYERMLARGYQLMITGISMHRPSPPLFASADSFVLDDWR